MTPFLCTCENVGFGTYANQEVLTVPWIEGRKRQVCVDRCIIHVIMSLWSLGIITDGSCCGHGKSNGSVAVDTDHVQKMKMLGFELWPGYSDIFVLPMIVIENGTAKHVEDSKNGTDRTGGTGGTGGTNEKKKN